MASRPTRSNSQGQLITLADIQAIVRGSEERVLARLDDITTRLVQLEDRLNRMQLNQTQTELDVLALKDIIANQQKQLEKHETEGRRNNLIFMGIPESNVVFDDETLTNDSDKISSLCNEISDDLNQYSIQSCFRLGTKTGQKNRPIKVVFSDVSARNKILYSQKRLRENSSVVNSFGRIFVNKDSSFLMRREEVRLREAQKAERSKAPPNTKIYIRSGKLYKDDVVIDQVNIINQLF